MKFPLIVMLSFNDNFFVVRRIHDAKFRRKLLIRLSVSQYFNISSATLYMDALSAEAP
jgi:hypothetical protein